MRGLLTGFVQSLGAAFWVFCGEAYTKVVGLAWTGVAQIHWGLSPLLWCASAQRPSSACCPATLQEKATPRVTLRKHHDWLNQVIALALTGPCPWGAVLREQMEHGFWNGKVPTSQVICLLRAIQKHTHKLEKMMLQEFSARRKQIIQRDRGRIAPWRVTGESKRVLRNYHRELSTELRCQFERKLSQVGHRFSK